jgi:hypothetical protein
MTNIEEQIQQDLDNGNFNRICSNETLFKNYVYKKLAQQEELHRKELEQVMSELKDYNCPEAYGFEGPKTYPECKKCIICKAKIINNKLK